MIPNKQWGPYSSPNKKKTNGDGPNYPGPDTPPRSPEGGTSVKPKKPKSPSGSGAALKPTPMGPAKTKVGF